MPVRAAPCALSLPRALPPLRMASKVIKDKGAAPDAFELEVGQALADLEANSADLKAELRELYIVSAKEVDVSGRKAVVLFVPFRLLKLTHKIQSRLVRELEKKFSGKNVVIIAQRRIQRQEAKSGRTLKQKRPQSRTLTAVHDAILEDLVHPTEIVGKHIRYRADGSKLLKMWARAREQAGCCRPHACLPSCAALGLTELPPAAPPSPSPAQLPRPKGDVQRGVQARHLPQRLQEAHRQGGELRVPGGQLSALAGLRATMLGMSLRADERRPFGSS